MPHPPDDGPEPRPTDEDTLLVELLYGELEGEARARAEARVEDDEALAGELEAMRSVRSLFRDLPDEDPPQAATAKLLHAAATQGPSKPQAARDDGEDKGVWAWLRRVFAPIALHPGLAAAATLVLVAGVAGSLYLRGEGKVAEPEVPSSESRAASGERTDEPDDTAPERKEAPASAAPQQTWDEESAVSPGRDEGEATATGATRGTERQRPAETAKTPAGGAEANDDPRRQRAWEKKPKPDPAPPPAEESEYRGTRGEVEQTIDVTVPEVPAKDIAADEPSEPEAEAPPALADEAADEDKAADGDDRASESRELHQRAVTFARKGDCAAAAKLGARIRAIDSGYYRDVHVRDDDIARCQRSQSDRPASKK